MPDEAKCEDCGTEEGLRYEACPYAADINDDYTPVWLCEGCRDERAREI